MDMKQEVSHGIEIAQTIALGLSHRIHGNPELGFEEI